MPISLPDFRSDAFRAQQARLERIELWVAIALPVTVLFLTFISESEAWLEQHYFAFMGRMAVLVGLFCLLNFRLIPQLLLQRSIARNAAAIGAAIVMAAMLWTWLEQYIFPPHVAANLQEQWLAHFLEYVGTLALVFGVYTLIKYGAIALVTNTLRVESRWRFVTPGGVFALIVGLLLLLVLLVTDRNNTELMAIVLVVVPSGVGLYWLSLSVLLPRFYHRRFGFTRYGFVYSVLLFVLFFLVMLLEGVIWGDIEPNFSLLNVFIQLVITLPLSWFIYRRLVLNQEEVAVLQQELGQTNARLLFLRSQINPHFLFNALNTIYATALEEGSVRTSEGIEKLGDMMRFMLHENLQDKISIHRELEYLRNYIALQRLRTDTNPSITIAEEIEVPAQGFMIAPMLLIPFVENAFKHGISLREPSFIRISLSLDGVYLYFDVQNSRHSRPDNDPEEHRSGIGLENVRQRLALLYPACHDLVIHQTNKAYFAHLKLRITT